MKKAIRIILIIAIIAAGGGIAFLLTSKLMLVRLPVLVHQAPKVTFVIGDVTIRKSSDSKWQQLIVGRRIKQGEEIKTEKNSVADIFFHDGMAIRVAEKSVFKLDISHIKQLQLNIQKGSVYGKFEKLFKDYKLDVRTPSVIAGIRGTELGFEVFEQKLDDSDADDKDKKTKNKKKNKKKSKDKKDDTTSKKELATTVYALSGITEVYNPQHKNQKILLSNQNKLVIGENKPASNPEKMSADKLQALQAILNSIHDQEVLLISDKITFKSGSAKILPQSFKELDKIAKIIKEKGIDIRVEGHTDSEGDAAFNQTLSEKRAYAIKEYFVTKGVEALKLHTKGYGESKPVASNKTVKGRAANRRVEFIIVEK